MSTIYRYLDVLSVEKCIDNINDFIKIKYIFIIMSVMCYFVYFCIVKTLKHYIMRAIKLKEVCKGCLFPLSDSETSPLWVRSFYELSSDNVNVFRYRSGNLLVYVED